MKAVDTCSHHIRDKSRICAEGSVTDDFIIRICKAICNRRKIKIEVKILQISADVITHSLSLSCIAGVSYSQHAVVLLYFEIRVIGNAGHKAAFLIHRYEHRLSQTVFSRYLHEFFIELPYLILVNDIICEHDDAAGHLFHKSSPHGIRHGGAAGNRSGPHNEHLPYLLLQTHECKDLNFFRCKIPLDLCHLVPVIEVKVFIRYPSYTGLTFFSQDIQHF